MNIHEIHDLSNHKVIALLQNGLQKIKDETIIKNYHPDHYKTPGNLFYILKDGRYFHGHGKYFVIEVDGEYICSAGWNEYDFDSTIALLLTRMYTDPSCRNRYFIGKFLLPLMISETKAYEKVWMTVNEHNLKIYKWIERNAKYSAMTHWPEIYKNLVPIGKRNIYYTDQYVMEFKRTIE